MIFLVIEYQDYCIHYLQSVPEQMQNEMTLLPSLISYNAKALHSHSMSILDQINWLNEQYCDKITEVNESSDINILNRISIQDKTLPSNVNLRKMNDIIYIFYLYIYTTLLIFYLFIIGISNGK